MVAGDARTEDANSIGIMAVLQGPAPNSSPGVAPRLPGQDELSLQNIAIARLLGPPDNASNWATQQSREYQRPDLGRRL
jgi:hypothetical protein